MKRAKDLDLRLAKAKLAIEKLRELLPYYQKGLVQLKPSPQEWVTRIHSEERKMANQHVAALLSDAIKRAQQSSHANQRTGVFDIVEEHIQKYKEHLGKVNIARWLSKIESEKAYLVKDLENASKKKSEREVALDQYKETLAMMKAEFAGSREQVNEIRRIEKLITGLGGQLPEPPEKEAKGEASPSNQDANAAHAFQAIPQKKTGTS